MGSQLVSIITHIPWFAWIAIVAIISGAVTTIVTARIRHAERMEMIRMGMNPDGGKSAPPSEYL